MAERATAGRPCRVSWGLRGRVLALVISGAIVAGAGILYLRRRQRIDQQNERKSLGGRETSDAGENEEFSPRGENGRQQGDVEAGLAKATVGVKEPNTSAPEKVEEKVAPAAKESAEVSSGLVRVGRNIPPITLGLSSMAVPLGAAPGESLLLRKRLEGNGIPSVAAAAVTGDAAAAGLADQGLYLTPTGPNLHLLRMMKGEDDVGGGFGEITFWMTKSGQELALKTAKDTASGRRQQRREVEFLVHFKRLHPDAANIVGVVEARTGPIDMLLMRKETMTLTNMVESAMRIDVGAVAKVLLGILTAIDLLHEAGFVQRDIKADNMLVGEDGSGILADFGLCIAEADAGLPEFLGDCTADYAAPEIASKRSGSTLCTELYSWFVVFVEAVMMRHPFGGEHLFDAKADRLEYLEEKRAYMIEDVDDLNEQLEGLCAGEEEDNAGEGGAEEEEEGEEEELKEQQRQLQEELARAMSKLEAVRIQEWRLGVRSPRQWQPTAADKAALASLGEPLSFFKRSKKRSPQREEMASAEAKADPSRLFEGIDWVEWLPGPSRADCKQGVRLAVEFVLGEGALHPDPECRPQDAEAARGVLTTAVALYEQQRQRESELERDDGARGRPREDSGAGG